ncbi:Uncharacterized protein APZ42_031100, partial [Daphnia magna]
MTKGFSSQSKRNLPRIAILLLLLVIFLATHQKNWASNKNWNASKKFQLAKNDSPDPQTISSVLHSTLPHYNLMEETSEFRKSAKQTSYRNKCGLDYMNANKMEQDHPCVIETIRQYFLNKPPPSNVPLKLDSNDAGNRSPGQIDVIMRLLKNQTKGFFVECGALDGEYMSNTIDLERKFGWSGILIEANPVTFKKLSARHRKAWTLPMCLSLEPFPTKVTFQMKVGDPGHSHIEGEAETLQEPGIPGVDPSLIEVQCFPFYSILLAVGVTQVDFLSLDVEGHELKILKTIPWRKLNIKTMTVEWDHIPEGQEALSSFMEANGFVKIGAFDFLWSKDVIFVQNQSISI